MSQHTAHYGLGTNARAKLNWQVNNRIGRRPDLLAEIRQCGIVLMTEQSIASLAERAAGNSSL
jgi:hypothetical protein